MDPFIEVRRRLSEAPPLPTCPADVSTSAITWLRERLGLSDTEEQVLWLLIAHELAPDLRLRIRELTTEHVSDPTLDVIRRIIYGSSDLGRAWLELGDHGSLRRLALVERTDADPRAPDHRHTIKASRRVMALVHGDRDVDPAIWPLLGADRAVAIDELEVSSACVDQVTTAMSCEDRLVVVHGGAGTGRRSLVVAVAAQLGRDLLVVDARQLATDRSAAEIQLRIVARECQLFERTPVILHLDALVASGSDIADRLDLVERELHGLVLATSSIPPARRWRQPPLVVELPALDGRRRSALWSRLVPGCNADLLASIFPIAPALVRAVGDAVARSQQHDADDLHAAIATAVRSIRDDRLAGMATRIDVTQTWDDLVLPDDQATALVELLARVRHKRRVLDDWGFASKLGRGLGLAALFSGPPGTGKTMCAGLVARELGTELYQVDLSRIVSKWIGETEQHLAKLFDAAQASNAILLFDEADALFGKRTEVKSSNDRHANTQVDYLLQRIEAFTGTCILTTNHDAAIDEAFRRRIAIHIRFPMPEADERLRLWSTLLPREADVEGHLQLDRLATQFAMSGGYIRNAVLRAAFLAANEHAAIGAGHLARAARLEYEAMGKVVSHGN